jgi:signal transduction histidine kinase/CheY-like chemotaxis protein
MCILDRNGHILRANQAMMRTFHSLPGTLIGRNCRDILGSLPLHGATPPADIVGEAPFLIEETTFPQAAGWFCLSAYPLKNEQDATTGVILIAKDITEAHAMRKALKKNETNLRQAGKMEAIGRLAGGIAHDFNNLLTSILGYSSLLIRSLKEDDPHRNDLKEIILAGERATALTRQLLYFSHEQALETKVLQLNLIIANIESFLRRTIGEDIALSTQLDKDLWNIRGDVSRLEQILMNLAINARDAMPKGGKLMIEASNLTLDESFCAMHPATHAGEYVLIEVSDTGHGMPPEVLDHIFEPFFTTKEKGKGTGLGLTTIYGIVRQFGGIISCYSEVNNGTTFKIFLPRCSETHASATDIIPDTALPRGSETVLVVDDESNIATMINQLLKQLGYQVLMATNGAQALTTSDKFAGKIDLALTDLIMPDLSGTELARVLAKKRPGIKVLYMSGYANGMAHQTNKLEPSANSAAGLLNDSYLQKPFSLRTLALSVRQALDQTAAPNGAAAHQAKQ